MPRWIFALIQFFPLSLFAGIGFGAGRETDNRWELAFEAGAIAALIQLAIVLPQRQPVNRLVLAANLYLTLGGLAFLTHQWWFLQFYNSLRETGILLAMLLVGVVTTFATQPGFAALESAPRSDARRASGWLLAATAAALAMSIYFRGNVRLAAVYPIIALAVLQRVLVYRAKRLAPSAPAAAAQESPGS